MYNVNMIKVCRESPGQFW